ncbi:MAG: hypothetical protein JWN02_2521 [Acidobacteria bacterium]|nr:hypothetical protein [Acidobacteriota bacterium]
MVTNSYQSKLHLSCEPSATKYGLIHARDVLPRWGLPRDVIDDALLIVDELITNAVRHAGTAAAIPFAPDQGQPTARQCALALQLEIGSLVIAVYDQHNGRPALRPVPADAEHGRGLQLVAGLSDGQWGCALLARQTGKLVWARLPVPLGGRHLQPQAGASEPAPSADPRRLDPLPAQARQTGLTAGRCPAIPLRTAGPACQPWAAPLGGHEHPHPSAPDLRRKPWVPA